ncbi:MAG: sterol desaturase/sphingolipid hydroxylase (fatty acid hydroxylase superfamily) [Paracoccaceae bacterium]|jgi:sterol desaturase/sphingolipid hydroxylase (fatty acid hydroxylase superfamily)
MAQETILRLSIFLVLFTALAVLELIIPKRSERPMRWHRWATNLSLVFIDQLAIRLWAILIPLLAIGAAVDATNMGWGLFNLLALPHWLEAFLAILALDFAIWTQHLVSHKVPLLWRFHKVHHADKDMDVTTALRFHPFEIAASMVLKIGVIYLIGPAAWTVLVFEILLSATAMFTHANIALAPWLDQNLRKVIVTPDMHRIHHAPERSDHDSNYGFFLAVWDRVFATYRVKTSSLNALEVGLIWPKEKAAKLTFALFLPFFRQK